MNQDLLNELAALNALGALEGDALHGFEQVLANADTATKARIAEFNNVMGLVGASPRSPQLLPMRLKAKVMDQVLARTKTAKGPRLPSFFSLLKAEGQWTALPVPGVRCKELSTTGRRGYKVTLYELAPGAHFPHHHHSGAEECFVLSGDFHVQGSVLHGGDFHHAEPGSDHDESFTVGGCELLVVAASGDYS